MPYFSKIAVVSAVALFLPASALNGCPGADTVFTGNTGIRYRVCENTDLVGDSLSITPNIANVQACAQLCDANMNCFKAVYDTVTRDCHVKVQAGLNWVDNQRFDVIQAEQVNIAKCPYPETTYTNNGKTYKICRDTDMRGASAQILQGVANLNACAQRCSTITGCERAVYDATAQVCHIKADARTNTMIWSTDKIFDVIRLDKAANPAADGQWSDMIRLPVIPVAAYIVPEFPSSQRMLMFSSWGKDSFGGEGGKTQFADLNFNTGAVSAREVANTGHGMSNPMLLPSHLLTIEQICSALPLAVSRMDAF